MFCIKPTLPTPKRAVAAGVLCTGVLLSCLAGSAWADTKPLSDTDSPIAQAPLQPQVLEPVTLPPMETDRPDITETPFAVPKGTIQVENGFTWSHEPDGTRQLVLPESVWRIGIHQGTEIRLGVPNYVTLTGNGDPENGFGDMSLGFKQEFPVHPGGLDLAMIGSLNFPTGGEDIGNDGIGPTVTLLWQRGLNEKWSVGGLFSFTNFREEDGRNFTVAPAVVVSRDFSEKMGVFLEYFSTLPHEGPSNHILHAGWKYKVTPTSQFDIHAGVGLTGSSTDYFIAGGYSFRTPKLW